MFHSLRLRIFLFVVLLILGTTATTLYFVSRNIEKTLSQHQEREAKNLIKSVIRHVQIEYNSIIFHKQAALKNRKSELKNIIDLTFIVIKSFHDLAKQGIISEQMAKSQAMKTLKAMRFNNGVGYIWINNLRQPLPHILMHPILPELEHKDLTDARFYCASGKKEHLFSAFVRICKKDGAGYVDYYWPKPLVNGVTEDKPKLSYVKLFSPWNWIIGTGLYIDDIDAAALERLNVVKKELKDILSKIVLAENGYMFIFDGSSQVIIHPTMTNQYLTQIKNIQTGNSLYHDFVNSLAKNNGQFDYLWDQPATADKKNSDLKRCYISYFAPLNWYICASIYKEEIAQQIYKVKLNIIMSSIVFFIIALVLSILLSKSLASPLQQLAQTAEIIEKQGLNSAEVPICGTTETRELGTVLRSMLNSIHERDQQLQGIAKNLPGTIYQLALKSKNDYEFIFMSEKASSTFDIPKEYALSFDYFLKRINPADKKRFLSSLATAASQKSQWFFEGRFSRKDGKILWIQGRGTPVQKENECVLNGILLDITEQKQTEMQLQQSRKMDSIGQLAGGVAHDFNNMLSGILGFSDLLLKKLDKDKKLTVFVKGIINAAENAADLTGKLLAFSRQAKNLSTPINVHEPITGALQILEHSINKKITISSKLSAESSIIIGDPAQLQNAFLNLGLNARDAMADGGSLLVTSDNVKLDQDYCDECAFDIHPGMYIAVCFEDTGCGIPKTIQEKIFDPFFTTKDIGEGTGLGLAALYGTIKDHHGAVTLYSEENKGTTFCLYFPIESSSRKDDSHAKHADDEELFRGAGCILVIEDEEVVRSMIKHLLKELGYTVILAENGQDGVNKYKEFQEQIDLIILDMVMPKMDGQECYYEIRKINKDVKVLLSSGFTKNSSVTKLLKDGISGFIKKPYHRNEVCKLIGRLLHSEKRS